jgi:hypothetical protein
MLICCSVSIVCLLADTESLLLHMTMVKNDSTPLPYLESDIDCVFYLKFSTYCKLSVQDAYHNLLNSLQL